MTSPDRPAPRNAVTALSMQNASEFASLRHGMTTDTSTGTLVSTRSDCDLSDANTVTMGHIISRSAGPFTSRRKQAIRPSERARINRPSVELAISVLEVMMAALATYGDLQRGKLTT